VNVLLVTWYSKNVNLGGDEYLQLPQLVTEEARLAKANTIAWNVKGQIGETKGWIYDVKVANRGADVGDVVIQADLQYEKVSFPVVIPPDAEGQFDERVAKATVERAGILAWNLQTMKNTKATFDANIGQNDAGHCEIRFSTKDNFKFLAIDLEEAGYDLDKVYAQFGANLAQCFDLVLPRVNEKVDPTSPLQLLDNLSIASKATDPPSWTYTCKGDPDRTIGVTFEVETGKFVLSDSDRKGETREAVGATVVFDYLAMLIEGKSW